MVIQIIGTNTINKGAELMLYAILQEIEKEKPGAKVLYVGNDFLQGYIRTKLVVKKPILCNRIADALHIWGLIRKMFHIDISPKYIARKGVDVVFDASGFCYADQQNLSMATAKAFLRFVCQMKYKGSSIIILPQALGPFKKEASRVLLDALKKTDMAIARDRESFDNLERVKNKYLYPDFTIKVKGVIPPLWEHIKGYITLVPNYHMFENPAGNKLLYSELLNDVIGLAKKAGKYIYVLNHEDRKDEIICYEIGKKYNIPVVSGLNALEIKGFISRSYITISSRFHGIINSLNSQVPCLATSWSFKYEMLFNDYGLSDCILKLGERKINESKINKLLDFETNKRTREYLHICYMKNLAKTEEMWKQVWNCIDNS